MSYLTQLAIITPYARFELRYVCNSVPSRNFSVTFSRRSEQMPPAAKEIKHHPASLNDLLVKQLIDQASGLTLMKFLRTQLSSINAELASRLIGANWACATPCRMLWRCRAALCRLTRRVSSGCAQRSWVPGSTRAPRCPLCPRSRSTS